MTRCQWYVAIWLPLVSIWAFPFNTGSNTVYPTRREARQTVRGSWLIISIKAIYLGRFGTGVYTVCCVGSMALTVLKWNTLAQRHLEMPNERRRCNLHTPYGKVQHAQRDIVLSCTSCDIYAPGNIYVWRQTQGRKHSADCGTTRYWMPGL